MLLLFEVNCVKLLLISTLPKNFALNRPTLFIPTFFRVLTLNWIKKSIFSFWETNFLSPLGVCHGFSCLCRFSPYLFGSGCLFVGQTFQISLTQVLGMLSKLFVLDRVQILTLDLFCSVSQCPIWPWICSDQKWLNAADSHWVRWTSSYCTQMPKQRNCSREIEKTVFLDAELFTSVNYHLNNFLLVEITKFKFGKFTADRL